MSARQNFDLAGNRPDVSEAAAIDAPLLMDHQAAKDLALEFLESALDVFLLFGKFHQRLRERFALHFGDPFVAFEFFRDLQRLLELGQSQFFNPANDAVIELGEGYLSLGFAELAP